jgi:hypothetical protein
MGTGGVSTAARSSRRSRGSASGAAQPRPGMRGTGTTAIRNGDGQPRPGTGTGTGGAGHAATAIDETPGSLEAGMEIGATVGGVACRLERV